MSIDEQMGDVAYLTRPAVEQLIRYLQAALVVHEADGYPTD